MKTKIRSYLIQWFSAAAVLVTIGAHAENFVVAKETGVTLQDKKDACLVATQSIGASGFVLGISDKGGGYINKLTIPGVGNIMDFMADRYGRGGQSAFRDYVHGQKYNPTQAGFTDIAGTYCQVDSTVANKLKIVKRRVCLWHGDQDYDFIQHPDPAIPNDPNDDLHVSDGYTPVQNFADFDGLPETSAKTSDEITSEWDYAGTYQYLAVNDEAPTNPNHVKLNIPAFYHHFEYTYARQPSTGGSGSGTLALRQHNVILAPNHPGDKGGWQESVSCDNIWNNPVVSQSPQVPLDPAPAPAPVGGTWAGNQTKDSMGIVSLAWATRLDKNKWPQAIYRWYPTSTGNTVTLTREDRFDAAGAAIAHAWYSKKSTTLMARTHGVTWEDQDTGVNPIVPTDIGFPLIIIGDSADENTGKSIGIYLANTLDNRKISAVDDLGGTVYYDDRRILVTVIDNPARATAPAPGSEVMELLGFKTYLTGILDPDRVSGRHEKMSGDIYIFYGTPNQILTQARAIAQFEALP